MRRREFIGAVGGAIAAPCLILPRASRGQHMPVIGFLSSQSPDAIGHALPFFRRGLEELGIVEGKNVRIEFRWAEDRYDRLPAMAAKFVRDNVAVIVAGGGNATALVVKHATATIPIIIPVTADPVKAGLVESFNRPGGNITGIALLTVELDAKRIELLREIVPKAEVIAALIDASRFEAEIQIKSVKEAAQAVGRPLVIASARTEGDFDTAFELLARERVGALLVTASPLFTSRRDHLVALAARYAIPSVFQFRKFVVAGGLVSYGASVTEAYHQAGLYVGRTLKGEKPSDLPIIQPTKFDLVINLKTAKALGLEVPPTLLARADEVIE
jgi:putative tryptophan/tyrosine transport system substrate-binding protein